MSASRLPLNGASMRRGHSADTRSTTASDRHVCMRPFLELQIERGRRAMKQ